jgi:hypothetical protein
MAKRRRVLSLGFGIGVAILLLAATTFYFSSLFLWKGTEHGSEQVQRTAERPLQIQIARKIQDRSFREAFEELEKEKSKTKLSAHEIAELDNRLVAGWLAVAQDEYDARHYVSARKQLEEIRACYPENDAIPKLTRLLEQRAKDLQAALDKGKAALANQNWTEALAIARAGREDFPEEPERFEDLRNRTVLVASARCDQQMSQANGRPWAQACDLFDKAYEMAKAFQAVDDSHELKLVLKTWVEYGRGRAAVEPGEARKVAGRILEKSKDDAEAKQLDELAQRLMQRQSKLGNVRESVEAFAAAVKTGRIGEAQKALSSLGNAMPDLPDELQSPLRARIGEMAKEVAAVAQSREATTAQVHDLLELYDKLTGPRSPEDFKRIPAYYQLALLQARSCEQLGKKAEALQRYDRLIQDREALGIGDDLDPVSYYSDVLKPAIQLGTAALSENPLRKPRLASYYALQGKLLLEYPSKDWSLAGQTPMREALDAFAQAIALSPNKSDPTMADYHARHGYVLLLLPAVDLKAVEKDWQSALQIDGNNAWARALKARYFQVLAQRDPRFSRPRIEHATQAIACYADAIHAVKDSDKEKTFLSHCRIQTSDLYTLRANDRPRGEKQQVRDDLKAAYEEAEKALRLTPESDLVLLALANAREGMAWSLLGAQPDLYPTAERAFQRAIRLREKNLDFKVGLARCYVKWAEDVPTEEKRFTDAEGLLAKVLQRNPRHLEANYWMGRVAWRREQKAQACAYFGKALHHATQGWVWLSAVDATVGHEYESWKPIFLAGLPEQGPYRAEDGPLLYQRCLLLHASRAFREADLKNEQPSLLADIEAAVPLVSLPQYQAALCTLAANALLDAMHLEEHVKQESAYRAKAIAYIRRALALDPNLPYKESWIRALAVQVEVFADEPTYPQRARAAAVKETLEHLRPALARVREEEREALKRLQASLENKLKELNP